MNIIDLHELYSKIADQSIPIYGQIKNLSYKLLQEKLEDSHQLSFTLSIYNPTLYSINFNQTFPGISVSINSPISYFIPSNASIYSSNHIQFEANYGGKIQFPFISLKQKQKSKCLMFSFIDSKGGFKEIRMKYFDSTLKISTIYYDLKIEPKQTIYLPSFTMISFQCETNLINSSLQLFKNLPNNPLSFKNKFHNSKFRDNFVLRVIELFQIEWNIKHKRIKSQNSFIQQLPNLLEEDKQMIGPINFIHLRDWSSNGDGIQTKFGNYLKPCIVGPKIDLIKLKDQIRYIQNVQNTGVGLYIQGYLISKKLFNQNYNLEWQNMELKDKNGSPYTTWGSSNSVMCSSCPKWRKLLANGIKTVHRQLQCEGFYIDEYGFGSRTSHYKTCTNDLHNHKNFDLQIGEYETLKLISEQINQKAVIYIQQTPHDISMKHISGSLSSAAKYASTLKDIPLLINRFVYPEFKIYELITEYTMNSFDILKNEKILQQNIDLILKGIMIAFWNGNGIYVPKNLKFYDKRVLDVIKQLNISYLLFKDYFSNIAIPLAYYRQELGVNQILKNKFINQKRNQIFTLINWTSVDQKEELFEIQVQMPPFSLGIFHAKYQFIMMI